MKYRISTYKELHQWSSAFVKGAFGLFFLIGDPGHAKSYIIRNLIKEEKTKSNKNKEKLPEGHVAEPLWIEGGAVSAFMLYQQLYLHLHELVVMDDIDSVYSDRNLVRLLKALCQSEKIKSIGWWTDSRKLDAKDIPIKFETRSRVCIIANKWRELNEHVGSLMSRGVMIEFCPSPTEVFSYAKNHKIITDKEILGFASQHLWMTQRMDLRDFLNAEEAKKAKLGWQDALAQSMGIRDMLIVKRLSEDKSYHTNEQRVMQFMQMTGLSRPMYFKTQTQLNELTKERQHTKEFKLFLGHMA